MSFKFQHKDKQYWAKETSKQTEVYLLKNKDVAERVAVLEPKLSLEEIELTLSADEQSLKSKNF